MKKLILPVVLIVFGIIEIILACTGFKLPLPIAIVLGIMFIVMGISTIIKSNKKQLRNEKTE